MKRILIIVLLLFIGCSTYLYKVEKDFCDIKFSHFQIKSIDLDTVHARIQVTIKNKLPYKIFVDKFDLYLFSEEHKLSRILHKGDIIFGNATKVFTFNVTVKYKDFERVIWNHVYSGLEVKGVIYFNLPEGNPFKAVNLQRE